MAKATVIIHKRNDSDKRESYEKVKTLVINMCSGFEMKNKEKNVGVFKEKIVTVKVIYENYYYNISYPDNHEEKIKFFTTEVKIIEPSGLWIDEKSPEYDEYCTWDINYPKIRNKLPKLGAGYENLLKFFNTGEYESVYKKLISKCEMEGYHADIDDIDDIDDIIKFKKLSQDCLIMRNYGSTNYKETLSYLHEVINNQGKIISELEDMIYQSNLELQDTNYTLEQTTKMLRDTEQELEDMKNE